MNTQNMASVPGGANPPLVSNSLASQSMSGLGIMERRFVVLQNELNSKLFPVSSPTEIAAVLTDFLKIEDFCDKVLEQNYSFPIIEETRSLAVDKCLQVLAATDRTIAEHFLSGDGDLTAAERNRSLVKSALKRFLECQKHDQAPDSQIRGQLALVSELFTLKPSNSEVFLRVGKLRKVDIGKKALNGLKDTDSEGIRPLSVAEVKIFLSLPRMSEYLTAVAESSTRPHCAAELIIASIENLHPDIVKDLPADRRDARVILPLLLEYYAKYDLPIVNPQEFDFQLKGFKRNLCYYLSSAPVIGASVGLIYSLASAQLSLEPLKVLALGFTFGLASTAIIRLFPATRSERSKFKSSKAPYIDEYLYVKSFETTWFISPATVLSSVGIPLHTLINTAKENLTLGEVLLYVGIAAAQFMTFPVLLTLYPKCFKRLFKLSTNKIERPHKKVFFNGFGYDDSVSNSSSASCSAPNYGGGSYCMTGECGAGR